MKFRNPFRRDAGAGVEDVVSFETGVPNGPAPARDSYPENIREARFTADEIGDALTFVQAEFASAQMDELCKSDPRLAWRRDLSQRLFDIGVHYSWDVDEGRTLVSAPGGHGVWISDADMDRFMFGDVLPEAVALLFGACSFDARFVFWGEGGDE